MKIRLLAAALVAASAWTVVPAANAVEIIVREAPPPMRVEPMPAPRPGYTWGAGHWDWNGSHYIWAPGTWVSERPGYVYNAPTWVQREDHWERREENWARRDADHDGIPNGEDRHPDNPNRR